MITLVKYIFFNSNNKNWIYWYYSWMGNVISLLRVLYCVNFEVSNIYIFIVLVSGFILLWDVPIIISSF